MSTNADIAARIAVEEAERPYVPVEGEKDALRERVDLDVTEKGEPQSIVSMCEDPAYEEWLERESRKADDMALALSDHMDHLADVYS